MLFICKFDSDLIENEGALSNIPFPIIYCENQGTAMSNSKVNGPIWLKFEVTSIFHACSGFLKLDGLIWFRNFISALVTFMFD